MNLQAKFQFKLLLLIKYVYYGNDGQYLYTDKKKDLGELDITQSASS